LLYNAGISTYVWIVTNRKSSEGSRPQTHHGGEAAAARWEATDETATQLAETKQWTKLGKVDQDDDGAGLAALTGTTTTERTGLE
jgi:hypothetical protein